MTIFLGQVATKMWQDFDQIYYERNKKRMLSPYNVPERTVEMIHNSKNHKNGDSFEMYNI
jgi:short-subunit dehydrogenase